MLKYSVQIEMLRILQQTELMSKVHEETVRGTLSEIIAHFTEREPKGEFVIVVGGLPGKTRYVEI